jgi:hypothetical protein
MAFQAALIPLPAIRKCTKCKETFSLSEFYNNKTGRDGLNAWCKKCVQACILRYAKTPKGRAVRNKTNKNTRRKPYGRALVLWHAARVRAHKNALDFTLTVEWVREKVMAGHCELSGIPFDFSEIGKKSNAKPYSPSIDKINSHRGYTPDNCRVICWALNSAFGHWGEEEFVKIFTSYLNYKDNHK